MSAEEQIIQRISSAGPTGLRKTELRKEFPQPDTDALLEKLSKDGLVFIDKKGTAHYCWVKESYMQYLQNIDPKFRLTHEAIHSLEQTVRNNGDRLLLTIGEINSKPYQSVCQNTSQETHLEVKNMNENSQSTTVISLDSFKVDFDEAIARFSTSIGWVDFGKIRGDLGKIYDLDENEFYNFAEQLITKHPDKYELSSGGYEGLTVRGLLHGFVRCI
jgi:hypothetical protein